MNEKESLYVSVTEKKYGAMDSEQGNKERKNQSQKGDLEVLVSKPNVITRKRCTALFFGLSMTLVIVAAVVVVIWKLKSSKDILASALVCSTLPSIPHSEIECTDGSKVESTCTVLCVDHHIIKGTAMMTCNKNGSWSAPPPSCVCPKCFIGNTCEFSTDWGKIKNTITGDGAFNYAGFRVSCRVGIYRLQWDCRCTDLTTGHSAKCYEYASRSGACKHAGSELIRELSEQKIYPPPCHPDDLDKTC